MSVVGIWLCRASATLDAIIPTSNREGPFDVCLLLCLVSLWPFEYSRGKLGSRTNRVASFFAFRLQQADKQLM